MSSQSVFLGLAFVTFLVLWRARLPRTDEHPQCDEEKPCSSCIRFGLACDLFSDGVTVRHDTNLVPAPVPKRGRGRPRKTWTTSPLPETTPDAPGVDIGPAPINLDNAELLLHFVTTAAGTLAGNDNPDMHQFWPRNVPQIGLSHTFVLHLLFALAAFHLAHVAKEEDRTGGSEDNDSVKATAPLPSPQRQSRADYLSLAQRHFTAGLSGFSSQLSQSGPENCGALYLGAVLTSYCTFAAGPTSRDDLLVCTADSNGGQNDTETTAAASSSASWMPFVHGVRLMHQSFSPDVLFAGLMGPLNASRPPEPLEQPVYARDGFPRLDWEAALDGLRAFIAGSHRGGKSQEGAARVVEKPGIAAFYLRPLDSLIGIYAATYGRRRSPDGEVTYTYNGPPENQFVFGWLYRLEAEFVACVRRRESHALLVLAHYAVLLNGDAVRGGWYVDGWTEHIIATVGGYLGESSCGEWMRWPMEQLPRRGGSCSG